MPHFELFVLNFNGERYLSECLSSLQSLNLGSHTLGINVIDNGSTDNSAKLVADKFPKINFIPLGKNLGFSNGNNLGVKIKAKELSRQTRRADFNVFLNNDTVVESDWLIEAAAIFEKDQTIGVVGSKATFYDQFVVITIECKECFSPKDFGSSDSRILSVRLQEPIIGENLLSDSSRTKYLGAYLPEGTKRWLTANSTIYLPIKDSNSNLDISFELENLHPNQLPQNVTIKVNGRSEPVAEFIIEANNSKEVNLPIDKVDYVSVVQNAGSYLLRSWESGDIGFMEIDRAQFDVERETAAICGASLFIREKLFSELGGFEPYSFAYYEDTDLCLRAWLKGWKCVYCPKSRYRHVHCGSSIENSNYFVNNVTYSRLLLASKMMTGKDWRKLLNFYFSNAVTEYRWNSKNFPLANKPYFQAIKKYLIHLLIFLRNRVFANLQRPTVQLKNLFSN